MRKPKVLFRLFALVLACASAVALSGCQQLFTTSLGKSLARDKIALPKTLTASQAADLAQQAKDNNDQSLAAAVVEALVGQVSNPATQPELAAAAASAAITASGASDAVLDAFATAMSSGNMSGLDAATLLATIQAGATDNVVATLSFLADIGDPSALQGTQLGATDYLIAAVVIAASALPEGQDPTTLDPGELSAFQATQEYATATAILGQAILLVEPGSMGADLLGQLSGLFQI